MNELIERLAREAGFDSEPNCLSGNGEDDRRITVCEYPCGDALSRFAALVAEQCFLAIVQGSEELGRDDELTVRRRAELIRAKFPMPKP